MISLYIAYNIGASICFGIYNSDWSIECSIILADILACQYHAERDLLL